MTGRRSRIDRSPARTKRSPRLPINSWRPMLQARKEALALQRDLQTEQATLGHQRDVLEEERRQLAGARHRDPIIAALSTDLGLILACLVPLALCGYLLRGLRRDSGDEELAELLTVELVSDTPTLLPRTRCMVLDPSMIDHSEEDPSV